MTLTRTQMHERAGSLSGEIKAAREAQSECRRALEDQERLVTIATQAVIRADARVEELLAERAELAQDMANAILQVGEAPLADEAAPSVPVQVIGIAPVPPNELMQVSIPAPDFETALGLGAKLEHVHLWSGSGPDRFCVGCGEPNNFGTGSPFPNAIFNGVDRAFDEATQP